MKNKQIVAIGGGGFGRSIGNLKIEKYIINLSKKENPKICFIPTATGDDNAYKVNFYRAFCSLNCIPSHIDFFKRTIDLKEYIKNQDIIYIGGGNTKSMLGVWREWDLDKILEAAYKEGKIMCGVSAGAICWFSEGISDSWANRLSIIKCLGFIDGICCPHYDEEPSRIPFVKECLEQRKIKQCIAIEGNCALHLINGKPYKSISFGSNKKTHILNYSNTEIIDNLIDSIQI